MARDLLEDVGAVDHADLVSKQLVAKAKERLSVLKNSPQKQALKQFADYMVTRKA
jgi:geranylgeranyl pyrophosphate synthase